MNNYVQYIVFLLICILSRVVSAIYYIEDPDSLRFALCVFDQFDLRTLQPHFPGYPVFCFIAKIFYLIVGNFSIVFSIIGGISVFVIIVHVLKLLKLPLLSLEGMLTALFIFFNPLIWLMSNKFMPDLAGVALMIAAFSYLVPDSYRKNEILIGWFLAGMLAGLRLSYIPFLIVPCMYAFFTKKKYILSLTSLCVGLLVWLVPLIMDTGWDNLIEIAQQQSVGHFYDFGGTVFTENDYGTRFICFIQSIWADGLGGYWPGRNPALLITSVGMVACLFFGFLILMSFDYPGSKVLVLLSSLLLYALWVFFFQNIIYNSRHILPLIPFILILTSYGIIYFLVNYNYLYVKVLMLLFLLGNIFITVVLTVQHTNPTAIAQAKEYIVRNKHSDEDVTIVSIPLINDFLAAQKVRARYISVHQDSVSYYKHKINSVDSGNIILIGNKASAGLVNKKPMNIVRFEHNPYVNRIWAEIYVYQYYLKE